MFLRRVLASFISSLLLSSSKKKKKMLTGLFLLSKQIKGQVLDVCDGVFGDILPPFFPLDFLCYFVICYAFEKKNCSIRMCCSLKSRALLWMHECVSASLSKRQSPFVPTASHILGHTAASWPQLHGTQGKKREKQMLVVLLVAIHHLSENYT